MRNLKSKYVIAVSSIVIVLLLLMWPLRLSLLDDPYCNVIEDENGMLLSAQIAEDGQWRFPIIDSLPQNFIDCIMTYEDRRFYDHIGVDFRSVIRAVIQNIKADKIVSGASTIPMQLMRMSMNNNRTIWAKIKESVGAIRLDFQYDKDQLLKIYASHAPFGGNVVGLEAATWKYFNKSPHDLSWAEMATLAVLPNAPSLIRFDKRREKLLAKRNFLLYRLFEFDKIDDIELELSLAEPLASGYYELAHHAPHFLEFNKQKQRTGKIKTSINIDWQKSVNSILTRYNQSWAANGIHNAAVIVIDNRTTDVKVYSGNVPSTQNEKHVDMIQAERSSGSILKPLLYAAMLNDGDISPDAFVKDIPLYIGGFSPANYNKQFSGLVPTSEALSRSLNVPFVVLLQLFGVEKFRRQLFKIGLSTINKSGNGYYGLSLILGGAEVKLWDLVHVYAKMSQTLTTDNQFNWSKGSIYHTLQAMTNLKRPDERGDWEQFESSQRIAWKTGTSYGHRDAWAIGVTPDYTVGVWAGNADGEGREQIVGVSTAGEVLFDVIELLPRDRSWFDIPYDDMVMTEICESSGMLPNVHCQERRSQWVSQSVLESPVCSFHITTSVNEDETWQMDKSCAEDQRLVEKAYLTMSPIEAEYYYKNHPNQDKIPQWHPDCLSHSQNGDYMEIVYPNPEEKIFIPRDFNNDRQKVVAELAHHNPEAEVFWYINKRYVGSTRTFHSIAFNLTKGDYRLYCIDDQGQELISTFSIVNKE